LRNAHERKDGELLAHGAGVAWPVLGRRTCLAAMADGMRTVTAGECARINEVAEIAEEPADSAIAPRPVNITRDRRTLKSAFQRRRS
jgi:hypothetical protein